MALPLNSEQCDAVQRPGSLVLSAGAGSGKTGVLVERYIKYLRDGCRVAQLVAITFTEKAAREMRLRIRERLAEIIRESPDTERDRWKLVAQDLETAAIDTIHAYCRKLLEQHEAAFAVLDDTVAATIRNETILSTLQTLLLDSGPLAEDLHELIVLFGWQQVVNAVEDFLHAPDLPAWTAFAAKSPATIAAEWTAIAAGFLPSLIENGISTSKEIAALRNVTPATKDGAAELALVLGDLEKVRVGGPASLLLQRARIDRAHARYKKMFGIESYDAVRDGYKAIRELITKEIAGLSEPPQNLHAAAEVSLRMIRVALHAEAAYAERKRSDGVLDFHDMIVRAGTLLRDNDEVRGRVQSEVQFLLLDELQDTDPLQMDLVKLLLGERFQGDGLFTVGDAKQSIYRFRGSDLTLFNSLRDALPTLTLVKNYRSKDGIIRFVNALCTAWFPGEALLEATQGGSAEPPVEFMWTLVDPDANAEENRWLEAASIAARVDEVIRTGRAKPGEIVILFRKLSNVSVYEEELRKLKIDYYLVGGRAFFAQQEVYDLANLLRAIENPFDAVALVGTLRSPFCGLSDDAIVAICHDAETPWQGLNRETIPLLPPAEQVVMERARQRLIAWRAVKDALPIARLVQRIFAESEYDAALLFEPLGERKLANLWKLQDIARQFDANGYRLAELVDHLENLVARNPKEEQAATVPEHATHVVRIMTIHQAKGLEFPVVIVADLGGDVQGPHVSVAKWHRALGAVAAIPPESEEEDVGYPDWPVTLLKAMERVADDAEGLRVLYVACTRAEELLILSASVGDVQPLKAHGPGLQALAQAYDLDIGASTLGTQRAVVRIVNARE